jgi:hypothetical protein
MYELIADILLLVDGARSLLSQLCKIRLLAKAEPMCALLSFDQPLLDLVALWVWVIPAVCAILGRPHLQSFVDHDLECTVLSLRVEGIMIRPRIAPLLVAGVYGPPVRRP